MMQQLAQLNTESEGTVVLKARAEATTVRAALSVKILCYLEIQAYQSISVSQLSPTRCTLHHFYIDYK